MYICNMIGKIFQAVLSATLLIIVQSCMGTGQKDTSLATLDELVARSTTGNDAIRLTADSAARAAPNSPVRRGSSTPHLAAADAFSDIDLHKALEHTLSALRISRAAGAAPDSYTRARLKLASLYNSQGYMTKESSEIFESLDTALMDSPTRDSTTCSAYSCITHWPDGRLTATCQPATDASPRHTATQYSPSRPVVWQSPPTATCHPAIPTRPCTCFAPSCPTRRHYRPTQHRSITISLRYISQEMSATAR